MFERFTGEARTAVVLAQVQARDLGHDYIGTEHLLLALLATDSGVKDTLGALGVTADDVKAEILALVGRGEGAGSGHIPFTPRSKKVLELSLREAIGFKHASIQPEHILLGLLREGEGLAAQILHHQGVDLGRLRQEVMVRLPPVAGPGPGARRGPRRFFARGEPEVARPMTAGAARVAGQAAKRAGDAPVASQHYLLGLLDDEVSLAAKTLAALGVTRDQVEAKLAELGSEGTSDEPPAQWGARHTSVAAEGDLVMVRITDADLAARVRHLYGQLDVRFLQGPDVLPGADRLWLAIHPLLEQSVRQLEGSAAPAPEPDWQPPGWMEAGAATYAVVSKPEGPAPQLWTAEGVDPEAVRAYLADWVAASLPGPRGDEPVVYLAVNIGKAGDIVPDAADPDAFFISRFTSGAVGPRLDWPHVALATLVAAAVDDLSREPAA